MHFNAGDSIYFKSGDYWEGMFWINGSGSFSQPIVIDIYGGNNRPIINGFGYQASILIFNDEHIHILTAWNSIIHFLILILQVRQRFQLKHQTYF